VLYQNKIHNAMKSALVFFNKSVTEQMFYILEKLDIKGFTYWDTVYGKGEFGEPRMGTHTWPEENSAIFVANEPDKIDKLAEALKFLDETNPEIGIKMFSWPVEKLF